MFGLFKRKPEVDANQYCQTMWAQLKKSAESDPEVSGFLSGITTDQYAEFAHKCATEGVSPEMAADKILMARTQGFEEEF